MRLVTADPDGRPSPQDATTTAMYVDALLRLKNWTGLSYRQLEKRAAAMGDVLPRTTLTAALSRDGLPREELVSALVRACGQDEADIACWVTVRRGLAAAVPATVPTDPAEPRPAAPDSTPVVPAAPPGPLAGRATSELPTGLGPPATRQVRLPRRFLIVVLVSVVTAIVTAAVMSTIRDRPAIGSGQPSADARNTAPGNGGIATPTVASAPSSAPTGHVTRPSPNANTSQGDSSRPRTPRPQTPAAADTTTATTATVADTTIVKGAPNAANGRDPIVSTCGRPCADSSIAGFERRTLLKFDLPAVPAGHCPTAVTLRLWAKNAAGAFTVFRTADWSEATASWNNQPSLGPELDHAYGPADPGWLTFRLPADNGDKGIHAYEIEGTDTRTGEFASREDATIARPAQLIVTYATCR
jgi:hypothetical protein